MKRMGKKFISYLLVLVMLLGIVSDFNPQSLSAATTSGINVVCNSLQIDGTMYSEGVNINSNSEFTLDITWTANNENGQLGDRITIDLPSCINFDAISGYPAWDDAGNQVGIYSVVNSDDGDILVLDVTNTDAFKRSNLKGTFTIAGVLDSTKVEIVDGTTSKLELFDKTYSVKIKPQEDSNSVSIHKSTTGSYDSEKGQQFTITLTSTGVNSGLSITDIFDTSALELNGDVVCTASDGKAVNGTISTNDNGFVYNFPSGYKTSNGSTYTLTYYLKVTQEGYKNHAGDWESNRAVLNTDTESKKTSDAYVQINKTWIAKTGVISGENVNWTIKINQGDSVDIAGASFSDILPDDFTLNSDVVISGSDGSRYVISASDVSSSNIKYVFPDDSDAVYTITYSTKVNLDKIGTNGSFNDITGSDTEKNTASINIPGYGEYTSSYGVHVPGTGDILSKSYTGYRYEDGKGYITWQSVITLPEDNDFTSIVYTDKVDGYWANHSLVDGTIRVNYINGGNTTPVTDYTLSNVSTGGYTIDFKNYFKGKTGSVVITYDTVIDTTMVSLGSTIWPSNSATVNVNGSTQTKSATYTYTNYPAINKGFISKNSDNTEFTWYFEINLDNVSVSNPVYITENLPENMVLDTTSLKAVYGIYEQTGSAEGISVEAVDTVNNTVRIKVDTEKALKEYSWYGNKICIVYTTKIDDYAEFIKDSANGKSYTNEVVIQDKNGNEIGKSSTTIDGIAPVATDFLSKNFKYDIYTAPYIEYEVNVNTDAVQMLDGKTQLELEDQLGTAITFVPGSLVVYTDSSRENPMDTSLYSYTYNTSTRLLKMQIPDSTACYISYKAKILLPVGTELTGDLASNTVKLSGSLDNTLEQTTTIDGVVLKGSALVTSELGSFRLYKHETGDENAPVAGAAYTAQIKYAYNVATKTVYEATDDTIKNYLTEYGGNYVPDRQYVTGSDGTVGISDIYYDFLYEIKEVSAPNGYQLNPNPVYYYIKGDDNADYSSLAALGIEAHEVTEGDFIYINDSKIDSTRKKIYINKLISGTTNVLAGAELKLTYTDAGVEKTFASWTSTNEAKEFVIAKDSDTDTAGCLIPDVEYTLTETSAPRGYAVANPISFKVSSAGEITITSGEGTLNDDKTVLSMSDDMAVYIAKIDADTSNYVTGAELELTYTDADGEKTLASWTTSASDKAFAVSASDKQKEDGKLCVGIEYTLKESKVPEHYSKAEDIKFTIGSNGKIKLSGGASSGIVSTDGLTLTMTDKAIGDIEITKVINANGNKLLAGAEFTLYAKDDTEHKNRIAQDTTDSNGKLTFKNIPYGEYVIVETNVPEGYLSVTEATNVVVNDTVVTKQISNTKAPVEKADLTVIKLGDSTNAVRLLGAVFTLTNAAGTDDYYATATTGANGEVTFSNVPFGTYVLTETTPPTGYSSVPDSITVKPATAKLTTDKEAVEITLSGNTVKESAEGTYSVTVTYVDSELTGSLSFKKVNDLRMALKDAGFELYDENGTKVGKTEYSDENGVVEFTGLKYGKYYLKESDAPSYHEITYTGQVVYIDSKSKDLGTIEDKQYSFSIGKIAKDMAGSTPQQQIVGATYEIYSSNDVSKALITFTTESTPKVIRLGTGKDELIEGNYILRETNAPSGYALGEDIKFSVDDKGKVTTASSDAFTSSDGLSLTVLENRTGTLKIYKRDAAGDHIPLDGVEFILTDTEGKPYTGDNDKGLYTTQNGGLIQIDNLPYGEYILSEQEPKDPNNEYRIIQKYTSVHLEETEKTITIYNIKPYESSGEITFYKKSADNNKITLEGAMFKLYDKDNNLIMTASSDAIGEVVMKNIPYGTYKLYEVDAPVNYKISEALKEDGEGVTVILDASGAEFSWGEKTDSGIVFTNEEKKGSLLVTKTDENGNLLEGATFELYEYTVSADGKSERKKVDTEQTTDENGKAVFENLSFGTYVLVETAAPDYYSINDAQKETVITINKEDSVNNGEITYAAECTITNSAIYVSFAKQSALDNSALAGARLQIIKKSDSAEDDVIVADWVSSDTSDFKLQLVNEEVMKKAIEDKENNKIAPGTYYLHEVYAPKEYFTADDIEFKIDKNGIITSSGTLSADSRTLIMRDEPKGQIILTKADATDKTLLLQATFELTKVGDTSFKTVEGTTHPDGSFQFTDLPYGVYSLQETVKPDGYQIITENIIVEVNKSTVTTVGNYGNNCVPVTVTNIQEDKLGNIELTKSDSQSDDVLEGAEFELINSLGKTVASATTNAEGKITFTNIPYGTYTIKETKAPENYGIDEPTGIQVKLSDDNTDIKDVDGKKYLYVTATDTLLTGSITITKTSPFGDKLLSGANFTLYDSQGNKVGEKETGKDGTCTFENLVYGTYTIKETQAPQDYILSPETREIVLESESAGIEITNEIKQGNLIITKLDRSDDSKQLSGATYVLYGEDKQTTVASGTTGSDGTYTFKNIPYGKYFLKETKAPLGYEVDNDYIDVTINSETVTVASDIASMAKEVSDELSKGKITLTKKDMDNTSKVLEGAKFKLYDITGNQIKSGKTDGLWITDENGTITIDGLVYGTYLLKETQAPEGYLIVTDDTQTVLVNGAETSVTVYNKNSNLPPAKTIYISKKAVGGTDELSGAVFKITDASNNELIQWESTSTPEFILVGDNAQGTLKYDTEYTLTETAAPDGYELAEPVVFKINENGKIEIINGTAELSGENLDTLTVRDEPSTTTVTTTTTRMSVNIGVSKRAMGQKSELSGAALKITDTDGNEAVFWISGSAKSIAVGDADEYPLKFNTEYILIETEAPNGYKIAAPIHFTINEEGVISLLSTAGELDNDGSTLVMIDVPSTVVDTGDHAPLLILGILLAVSLIVMIVMIVVNKKKSKEDDDEDE